MSLRVLRAELHRSFEKLHSLLGLPFAEIGHGQIGKRIHVFRVQRDGELELFLGQFEFALLQVDKTQAGASAGVIWICGQLFFEMEFGVVEFSLGASAVAGEVFDVFGFRVQTGGFFESGCGGGVIFRAEKRVAEAKFVERLSGVEFGGTLIAFGGEFPIADGEFFAAKHVSDIARGRAREPWRAGTR